MILLLDIGNTRSKYVCIQGKRMSEITYIDTQLITEQWFKVNFATFDQCIIANVSQKALSTKLQSWCDGFCVRCHVVTTESEKFGVKCAYQKPSQYGVDRWLTLLAAKKMFPFEPCIIVDSGTATTVDALSTEGVHLGGWILPGVQLMLDSITNNTESVVSNLSSITHLSLAVNTESAVNQACWSASIGLVNNAVKIVKSSSVNYDNEAKIIFTGGNGAQMHALFSGKSVFVEDLVFQGMQRYC